MWCLWNLGLLGEPLLGPFGLVAVYMLTGVAGNLLSLAYNVDLRDHDSVGAGASGAVFGIAGILIVLLSNHKLPIPWSELKRLRRSVIQFAALNLVIGIGANFTSIVNIDNSAHIGGFLSGLALGVPLVPRMTSGRTRYLQPPEAHLRRHSLRPRPLRLLHLQAPLVRTGLEPSAAPETKRAEPKPRPNRFSSVLNLSSVINPEVASRH